MIFQELILQNFGPYYGQQSLDLSTTADHPVILIGGLNGGGKTTIMDAIRLALYGQRAQCDRLTQRKLNDLEQLITQYFLMLLHKSSLVHRILVNAETFQLDLYGTEGQLIPTHRLSAGEKQLLAIAFL